MHSKVLKRAQLVPFFANRPMSRVVMEACGSAHCWDPVMARLGHDVWLTSRRSLEGQGERRSHSECHVDLGKCPAPWLVKFPGQSEQAEACSIEFFYADLARLADIQMPESQLFTLADDLAAFGIERFDRTNGKRFPIHTVAGLTHADFRHPALDYLSVLRLTRFLTADEREVLEMYHRRVVNVVFHNHDDHSINLPFLLPEDGQWGVAPGYDQTFCFLRES
jgi:hypothetical protein